MSLTVEESGQPGFLIISIGDEHEVLSHKDALWVAQRIVELANRRTLETPQANCWHQNFKVSADINRIVQKEGDVDPSAFMADLRIECMECGKPFEWIGVPMGLSYVQPNCSVDCLQLRAPVKPQGEPMPLAATLPGFGVKRTV